MSDAPNPGARTWAGPRARSLLFTAAAVVLGATVAGLYAHFIGCRTGTCPITSSVRNASLYGGFVGLIIGWPGRPRDRDGGSPRQPQRPHAAPEGAAAPSQR